MKFLIKYILTLFLTMTILVVAEDHGYLNICKIKNESTQIIHKIIFEAEKKLKN